MPRASRIRNKSAAASTKAGGRAAHGAKRRTAAPKSDILSLQHTAGNQAVSELLKKPARDSRRGGKPLKSETQAKMEQAFGADFTEVRIHDDSNAQAKAKAVGARAFTQGQDIYLGTKAPSVESGAGAHLLAHELAHVVQQERAGAVREGSVSQPGDQFEQAADTAARQAVHGQSARVHASGTPPGLQRDPEADVVSRAVVEAALTDFLERARQAQGGGRLQITTEVRNAIEILAQAGAPLHDAPDYPIKRSIAIQSFLSGGRIPEKPAELAHEIARRLPDPFDAAALERFMRMPVSAKTTMAGRVGKLIERTGPGEPERRGPVPEPSSQERVEKFVENVNRQQGRPEPTKIGPITFDPFRAIRILKGLPGAVRGERPQTPAPESRSYQQVDKAIQQISRDALVPAEARGGPGAGEFVDDARDFARDLAARLDVAQRQGVEQIKLPLGENYNKIRDRAVMIAEISRIIQLVRDALPHHASNVKWVDVYFGSRLVSRGQARSAE